MNLTVIASGSSGNGYILQNDNEALVIEAGVPVSKVLQALGFNSKKVVGCLISHEHGDHFKYVEEYMRYFPCYCSAGTRDSREYKSLLKPNAVENLKTFQLGEFKIRPIDVEHDAVEPFGFIIKHPEIGSLLFATDTYFIRYNIHDLTNIMIECNYDLNILNENVKAGKIHPKLKNRTLESHMSLQHCKAMLQCTDLTNVSQIVLLHLSGNNAEPDRFKSEVQSITGKLVHVATAGLTIPFNKTPFT